MSYQEERLQEIADAIREVKGTTEKIPATNFASEIVGLSVVKPSGIKTITQNGDYDVKNYAWASVNVEPNLITKEITENGTYKASDDGADGYSEVVVNVASSGGGGYNLEQVLLEDGTCELKITDAAGGSGGATGLPIEVTTDTEMTNALVEDNLGKVYKFTGTSDTYETDGIYIVSEVE